MEICLWNDKVVLAHEIGKDYSLEKDIRDASVNHELICIDPDCASLVIYKHGEIKAPHFAHLSKMSTCVYDSYDTETLPVIKNAKRLLYEHLSQFETSELTMDSKLLPKHYSHIAVKFCDGNILAIEIGTEKTTKKQIDEITTKYAEAAIPVQWFIVGDPSHRISEDRTYYSKRFQLNEASDGVAIVVNPELTAFSAYKVDNKEYQYNGRDIYPISSDKTFTYQDSIKHLSIADNRIVLGKFEEKYFDWLEEKRKRFEQYIDVSKELGKLPKGNDRFAPSDSKNSDKEPFVLRNIKIPRTQTPVTEKLHRQWDGDKFVEELKKAVGEQESAVRVLISKLYECDRIELAIFYAIYNDLKSREQTDKVRFRMDILEHILKEAKRDIPD